MELTPTRRSARIAALQKKEEETTDSSVSAASNSKKSPKKEQASKKVNSPRKKAQAPSKSVSTRTPKKSQVSKNDCELHDDDVDGLAEDLQNFSINSDNYEIDSPDEDDSVSSPDEDEGSIYEEESEEDDSEYDVKKPETTKNHTPSHSDPADAQEEEEEEEDNTNTSYSISFDTFENIHLFDKVDLEADRRKAEEAAAVQAKKDEEELRRTAAEEAAAEIERKRKEAERAAQKKREQEEVMQKKRDDTVLANKVLEDYNNGEGSFYNVLEVSRHASQDFIARAYKHQALKLHPDKNKAHNAADAFKTMKKVYEVLKCPLKRADHDRRIEAREASAEFQRQREIQRLRSNVAAEKQRCEWEVKAAMKAKRSAEKQASEDVKAAMRAKRSAEKQASDEVKAAMKAKKTAEKHASEEVKAALKAKKAAEKQAAKKSVPGGRSKSAPRPRTTPWEEFAPGTSMYNTIPPETRVRAYAHEWRGGLVFVRVRHYGQIQSFNVQSGHYIVRDQSNGKNSDVAVDSADIFQMITVQTRYSDVPSAYVDEGLMRVISYDDESSSYKVIFTGEGYRHTANISHYDFIIPNGTVVRLEDIPNDQYAWMNGKYGQIVRWIEEKDQFGNDGSCYVVQLSSKQNMTVHMCQVRL